MLFQSAMREISVPGIINQAPKHNLKFQAMNSLINIELDDRSINGLTSYEEVQCFPIETILLGLNVTKVTLFSLDVEGLVIQLINTSIGGLFIIFSAWSH